MGHETFNNYIESDKWTDCSNVDKRKRSPTDKCVATYIERKIKSEVNNFVLCKLQNYLAEFDYNYTQEWRMLYTICKDSFSDIHKRECRV